jgi:hypothetical protein
MNRILLSISTATTIIVATYGLVFGFTSGSTGSDGAFAPTANTEVLLPADGTLNYTTVNIPAGVVVTFTRNVLNSPVYLLTTGDVTIAGTINVSALDGNGVVPGKGGPGGGDGGLGGMLSTAGGRGLGAGGGNPGTASVLAGCSSAGGGGAGHGVTGAAGLGVSNCSVGGGSGSVYGNMRIFPLTGGSGGGGGGGSSNPSALNSGGSGGGGGGSLLIASSGTITVTGTIAANGGKGGGAVPAGNYAGNGGGGSGGSIKLMADRIDGNGIITATGGLAGSTLYGLTGGKGSDGRIRIEANSITRTAQSSPPYTFNQPGPVILSNMPALAITSVGGVSVPSNPSGRYGMADIMLPASVANPVSVAVQGMNMPVGTEITITAVPEYGPATSVRAALSGSEEMSTASAQISLSSDYQSVLTAEATYSVQTAMHYNGEKVQKVRVAASTDGRNSLSYITENGMVISQEMLLASWHVR